MDKIIKVANDKLLEWSKNQPKLVVAIDGYTGVGKTTLSANLVKVNPDIVAVHYDDFIISTKELQAAGTNQREEVVHHRLAEMEKLIGSFKKEAGSLVTKIFNPATGEVDTPMTYDLNKKILLIDGIFMFHPERLNHLWDKRIYLDGDTPEIDKRRVAREKARWGDRYHPETHPDSHFAQITKALKRYRVEHQPEKMADLVLWVD